MFGGLLAEPFRPNEVMVLLILGMSLLTGLIITVVGIVFGVIQSMARNRAEASLKREMLARGMSADEIVRVIAARAGDLGTVANAAQLPCACEAVVEWEGDWCPALVLQVAEGRYHVHYVGHDRDSDEWVGVERVRLPAGSPLAGLFAATDLRRDGAFRKDPVEAEV